jgi:hypothetical protein
MLLSSHVGELAGCYCPSPSSGTTDPVSGIPNYQTTAAATAERS